MSEREDKNDRLNWGILALVLAVLVVAPLAFGGVGAWPLLAIQVLTVAALGMWGVRLVRDPQPRLLWPPVAWLVAAFAAYAVVLYLRADIRFIARLELMRVLIYCSLFFIVLCALHQQQSVMIIAGTLIVVGVLESFYASYQFLASDNRVWLVPGAYKERGTGTYFCPNHLAGLLELILPLAVSFTLVARNRIMIKLLCGYAALMMLAGLAFTASRAGWIAACISMLALCALLLRYHNFRVQAALLLVAMLASGAWAVHRHAWNEGKFGLKFSVDRLAHDLRQDIWVSAWRMWEDNRWLGVGPGHFDYRFRQYRTDPVQARPDRVHNDYLNTLTDYGVIGGALMAGVMMAALVGVVQIWPHVCRANRDLGNPLTNKFAFVLGASTGLLALAVHAAVDFNLQIPANAIAATVLLACLMSYYRFATRAFWLRLGGYSRLAVILPLTAICVWLGWTAVPRARQVWLARQAMAAPALSLERLTLLQRAFAADPENFELSHEMGEMHRVWAWDGYENAEGQAREALAWYERGMKLNPHDPLSPLRYGMCLDWLGRTTESEPFYRRAEALDPNGYFVAAHVGWHFVQTGDFPAARFWFQRSLNLQPEENPIATNYLKIVEQRMAERAAEK